MDWFERRRKRRQELAEGADADLVQDNRRRFKTAYGSIGLVFVLGLLSAIPQLPIFLKTGFRGGAAISCIIGVVLFKWAQVEENFLMRPDQEKPPEIFRDSAE